MDDILISTERRYSATVIPNTFIDKYLASANGTYVKVYLYLLRCFNGDGPQFSIQNAADFLNETESDVKRALNYWEKNNVLALFKRDSEITGITLLDLQDNSKNSAPAPSIISLTEHRSNEPKESAKITEDSVSVPKKQENKSKIPSYTAEEIDAALNNSEIKMLADMLEAYLGRIFNNDDLSLVMFFYNELHFSADLIQHLYETCIEKNKKNNSYIQAVGIKWHEEGVKNVKDAIQQSLMYNAYYNAVNTAFNLGRLPGDREQKYMREWEEMGFSPEMVKEACDRTLTSKGKVSFAYANSILASWHQKGIKDFEALKVEDAQFEASKSSKASSAKKPGITKSGVEYNNRYEQRNYSENDMKEIERLLLTKKKKATPVD